MGILDVDDELADCEVSLPLQTPSGHSLLSSAPATLTVELGEQPVCCGWLWTGSRGSSCDRIITRRLYDYRYFLHRDGSTRRMKRPLAKGSVDGASVEGSSVLLMCSGGTPRTDEEDREEDSRRRTLRRRKGRRWGW